MAFKSTSPGLDAEDEDRTRTDEPVGYDSELDDEYDTGSDAERRVTPDGNAADAEHEDLAAYGTNPSGSVEPVAPYDGEAEAERNGEVDGEGEFDRDRDGELGDESEARAEAESVPDSFSDVGLGTPAHTSGETDEAGGLGRAGEPARDETESGLDGADEAPDPDPYRLGSPIPGQPNTGPVLVVPDSAPDSEPGLDQEAEYRQNPEIVGAAADQQAYGDDGLDEVDGRAGFDQAATGQEEVAGYDDSAAGYELAEQSAVQPASQAGDTGSQPLLPAETQDALLQRWTAIQVSFVDDPSESVRSAEALIRDIGTAIQEAVRERTEQISGSSQGTADTEQLRLSLQEYRSFLGVLLPK
jgi:hypothetical protein